MAGAETSGKRDMGGGITVSKEKKKQITSKWLQTIRYKARWLEHKGNKGRKNKKMRTN